MPTLSQDYINAAEEAILSDKLVPKGSIYVPSISCQYYDDAMEMWNLIQKSNINDYYEFASNAFGMQSYGFYKANNGEIYIIEAFINEISKIYIPSKNIDCLKDLIKENDEEKKVECDKS